MKKVIYFLKASLLLSFLLVFNNCQGQTPASQPKTQKPSKTNSTKLPAAFMADKQPLPTSDYGRIIKCAQRDRAGNLWFATTWAGVLRYDGKKFTQFTVKHGLCSNEVNTICEDRESKLWFGTSKGVCYYDGKAFINFPLPTLKPDFDASLFSTSSSNRDKIVQSIFQDRAGNLWFGIWAGEQLGAYRYDGKNFSHFFPKMAVQGIVEDGGGGIWLDHQRYDGKSFTDFSEHKNSFKKNVFCSLKDRNGQVWFGVRGDGLYRYDGHGFTYFSDKDGLSSKRVTCIFQDKKGLLWLGSDITNGVEKGSLCYYDGKKFTSVSEVHNLGMYSFWSAVEDQQGNIWFGGRGGKLCRYNGKTFKGYSSVIQGFK